MDFYDSLLQYDLEIQNKITERLNTFLKSINLLKNESLINQPNIKDTKYKHINILLDEINTSNKFKTQLLLNQKKQLLLRMNTKNKNKAKINSKYYIYAKDMNKDNQKMDIYQIDDTILKKDSNKEQIYSYIYTRGECDKIFDQKKICCENMKYNNTDIDKDGNIIDEENNLKKLKCDINKIVCDIIKQSVKSLYNKKINENTLNNYKVNKDKNSITYNIYENNTINNTNIKNNNYIKIDLQKIENKDGKENKKYHNNHSTEKNVNFINYFNDNQKKTIKKELRNSVTNNNGNHLKIKICKNDILNFNNLNNNNVNNLLIINNKIKAAKMNNINIIHNGNNVNNINVNNINVNINNVQSKKILDNENKNKPKEIVNQEKEDNNKIKINNNKNNKEKINNDKTNKKNNNNNNGDQNHKKMIIRNIQRIQIKNIKLKNNPTGYNLTNICKKNLEDDNLEKNYLKKIKQKERQCASPGDIAISNSKKINILKFKLGKNDPTPLRKNTERSFRKNKEIDNIENDNSIISILNDKTKDIYSQGIRFSSVKKKKICDEMSGNDLSIICKSKKINKNNFLIRNYKTNINRNNNNLNEKNSFTKESEIDGYFIINRNNNNLKKSLSRESGSHAHLPWNIEFNNAKMNKSNNKGNMVDSYLNQMLQIDKKNNFENTLKNINEYQIKKKNNDIYLFNENIIQDNNVNENQNCNLQKFNEDKIKNKTIKKKNKSIYKANNNFRENKNLAEAGYNDTINNKDELMSYRERVKMKGKRRILSTRVHIRGVNSSKNFNNIL